MTVPAYESKAVLASRRPSLGKRLYRAATSRPAMIAYVAVGTMGLAALALAMLDQGRMRPRIFPSRFRRDFFRPAVHAVSDQSERLWREAQPVRSQLRELIGRAASEAGREKLIRNFQSWIGHFRAS